MFKIRVTHLIELSNYCTNAERQFISPKKPIHQVIAVILKKNKSTYIK